MKNPHSLVSILLAVFNGECYLKEAIESVLNQSHQNFELIIVDNASDDSTSEIVSSFAKKDSRIKYYFIPEKGKNRAYNYAFGKSSGDFICFFAADDILTKTSIANRLAPLLGKHECFSTCLMMTISANSRQDRLIFPKHIGNPNYSGGSIFFTRNMATQMFPLPESLPNEDTWAALHLKAFGQNIHLEEVLYKYRIHSHNTYGYVEDFMQRRSQFVTRMEAYSLFMGKWFDEDNTFIQKTAKNYNMALELFKRGKILSILIMGNVSIRERLKFLMMSYKFLFDFRNKFFRFFSGFNV